MIDRERFLLECEKNKKIGVLFAVVGLISATERGTGFACGFGRISAKSCGSPSAVIFCTSPVTCSIADIK